MDALVLTDTPTAHVRVLTLNRPEQQIMATFSKAVPEAGSAFLEKRPAEFAD